MRNYEFKPIPEAFPGCTYGKYWHYVVRTHGQSVFKETMQAYILDLDLDPWDVPEEDEL